jgi:hypothetical protein
MKQFLKDWLVAIPFAIGLFLTIFSVVYALDVQNGDSMVAALFNGIVGIPLLFASMLVMTRRFTAQLRAFSPAQG